MAMMYFSYPDKWLRIIGIPLLAVYIRNFGMYEPLHKVLKTKIYYIDLGWNLLTVFAVWETNRQIIKKLDKSHPWVTRSLERLLIQGGLVLGISIAEVIFLTFLYNEVLLDRPDSFSIGWLMVLDVPLTMVFVVLINLIYTGMYLLHYHRVTVSRLTAELANVRGQLLEQRVQKPEQVDDPRPEPQKQLIVNYGYSSVPLATDKIAHVFKANELCLIKTFDGKEYTSNSSLEHLESILSSRLFFRLNRQTLAHVQAIKQFKTHSSGKLAVYLEPVLSEEIYVSKKKAPEFKDWLGKKV